MEFDLHGKQKKLSLPAIYPITDDRSPLSALDQVKRVGQAGLPLMQYRTKSADLAKVKQEWSEISQWSALQGGWPSLCLNDRIELLDELPTPGLWGIHVGQGDAPVSRLREQFPNLFIGLSTHDPQHWAEVNKIKPDYIGMGPVNLPYSKKSEWPVLGFEGLRQGVASVKKNSAVPIVAIGGLLPEHFATCFDEGAHAAGIIAACTAATNLKELFWETQKLQLRHQSLLPSQGLILIGHSGSGKSTLGKRIASVTQRPFLDLDSEIEAAQGVPLRNLINDRGLSTFRELELSTLQRCWKPGHVVALGGGTWHEASIRSWIKTTQAKVLWLSESPATCWSRLQKDYSRPLAPTWETFALHCLTRSRDLWSEASISGCDRSPSELCDLIVGQS